MQEGNDPYLIIFKSWKLLQYVLSYCILVSLASKKRVKLRLNAKVKVIEASEKGKLTRKQIVGKFKIVKT
jgi:hypothetical protein